MNVGAAGYWSISAVWLATDWQLPPVFFSSVLLAMGRQMTSWATPYPQDWQTETVGWSSPAPLLFPPTASILEAPLILSSQVEHNGNAFLGRHCLYGNSFSPSHPISLPGPSRLFSYCLEKFVPACSRTSPTMLLTNKRLHCLQQRSVVLRGSKLETQRQREKSLQTHLEETGWFIGTLKRWSLYTVEDFI